MDPEPIANPYAELVIECFQEGPALQNPARDWSPATPPLSNLVKGSRWGGVGEPSVGNREDQVQEGKVVEVLFDEGGEESDMPPIFWDRLPGLACHGGDCIGHGQQIDVVEDRSEWELDRGCTLPGLKELGLDRYIGKRD